MIKVSKKLEELNANDFIELQKKALVSFLSLEKENKELTQFIRSVFSPDENNISSELDDIVQSISQNIEQKLEGIRSGMQEQLKGQDEHTKIVSWENRLKDILKELEKFNTVLLEGNEKYKNAQKVVNNLLSEINNNINDLSKSLAANNKKVTIKNIKGEQVSLFRSIAGLSADIKGALLEEKITEFINKKLSELNKNIDTINSGNFTIQGKSIKEDILLGEDLKKMIEEWEQKHPEAVNLSDDMVKKVRQQAQHGISVKMAKDENKITLHKGMTLKQLQNWSESTDEYRKIYNQISKKENRIVKAYANYLVSKNLKKVVGEGNDIFIHRNRVMATHEYLNFLLDKKRYAQARKPGIAFDIII